MKTSLLVSSLLVFSSFLSFSQDTIYLNKAWKETTNKTTAEYYRVLERTEKNPDAGFRKTYFSSGQIKVEEFYSSFQKERLEGKRKLWREDGSLWTEADYKKGKLNGSFVSYWPTGQLKRKDLYKKGKWKEGSTWDEAGKEVPWYPMEEKPKFPGGQKALIKYLQENAKKPEGVAGGRVKVGFVIDKDGSITDVAIEESSSPALNLAAYTVVAKMPAWEPGKQDGNVVRVKYSLPLNFR